MAIMWRCMVIVIDVVFIQCLTIALNEVLAPDQRLTSIQVCCWLVEYTIQICRMLT